MIPTLAARMNPIDTGARVEAHQAGPCSFWSAGYRFVRYEDSQRTCLIIHTEGTYEGTQVRYPIEAVRREQPRGVGERVVRVWPAHGPGTVREFHLGGACASCTGGPHAQVEWDDKPGETFDEDPGDLAIYEEPAAGPASATIPVDQAVAYVGDTQGFHKLATGAASLRRDVNTGRAWLEFQGKPDKLTCEALSAAGWRFSGFRKQWNHPRKFVMPPAGITYVEEGTVSYSDERPERLKKQSVASRTEAMQLFERERRIGSAIPMGQPILVGHHSEKRHRRDIAKIQNLATRGVEALKEGERLDAAAASSARLRLRRQTDPGLIERRLKKLRTLRDRMEDSLLSKGENPPDADVRRACLVREEIERNEKQLAELQAAADAPAAVNVGDVIASHHGAFLVARVNHRTFTGWIVGGGSDAWPGRFDKTKWGGKIICRANAKLHAAIAHRTKLKGYYGDDWWRRLTAEGLAEGQ